MEDWRYSSTIPEFGTRWRLMVRFALLSLYLQGRSPRYALDRRLGQNPMPVWTTWRKEKSCPYQELNPRRQVRSVAQYRLITSIQILYLLRQIYGKICQSLSKKCFLAICKSTTIPFRPQNRDSQPFTSYLLPPIFLKREL
jgi:hypothetical protein